MTKIESKNPLKIVFKEKNWLLSKIFIDYYSMLITYKEYMLNLKIDQKN